MHVRPPCRYGGAFYLEGGARLFLIEGSSAQKNCAALGGAAYLRQNSSVVLMDGSAVAHNQAVAGGGLLALDGSSIELHTGAKVEGNLAADVAEVPLDACDDLRRGGGGGIYLRVSLNPATTSCCARFLQSHTYHRPRIADHASGLVACGVRGDGASLE